MAPPNELGPEDGLRARLPEGVLTPDGPGRIENPSAAVRPRNAWPALRAEDYVQVRTLVSEPRMAPGAARLPRDTLGRLLRQRLPLRSLSTGVSAVQAARQVRERPNLEVLATEVDPVDVPGAHRSSAGDKPLLSELRELEQLLNGCENLLEKLAGRSGPLDRPLRAEIEEVHRRLGERLARLGDRTA